MDTALYFFFTAAYIGLTIWGVTQQRSWNFTAFLYLVLVGLIYDNGIIAIGKYIGEGSVLESLNLLRFWSHAFFTPLLVLFCWGAMNLAHIRWARQRAVFYGFMLYTAALIIIELALETWSLELMTEQQYGVLRYVSAEPASGPPIMVLLVTVALVFTGAVLWRKAGWKWMLIGAVIMGIGSAVPIPVDSSAVTNAFELFLLFTLVWTKNRLETNEKSKGFKK
ncbi:hypothetical protein FQV26_15220 [Planococcus sp. CPCC 101016]|uniref:hypothetical protein n=1 Tax=Planococcus sp. CPCC 101016 TaxID=2599617 RepID=UPI0011B66D52|nr:hypothetical protein [Planococcus sp. CPCC 101016]TWT04287.1 hypothetical protein FQV26_15220 [Planococcus sp. CPCC 101016]